MADEKVATSDQLAALERDTRTPRQIALLRIRMLSEQDVGLASIIAPILDAALRSFAIAIRDNDDGRFHDSAELLRRVLEFHIHLTRQDVVLAEELASLEGSHKTLLSDLVKFDSASFDDEACQDVLMELQDLACEIAACSKKFSRMAIILTDLKARLPLIFEINDERTINRKFSSSDCSN